MRVTLEQLAKILLYSSASKRRLFVEPLNDAMAEFEIDTPLRQAAFIAQIAHESGCLNYVKEIASGAAYDHRKDLGNTRTEAIRIAKEHGTTPGRWWRGHGLIQVTGFDNHKKCGEALGLDLLNSPGLITTPDGASRSAAWFWSKIGGNDLADREYFKTITRRINGGLNGYNERRRFYYLAKKELIN